VDPERILLVNAGISQKAALNVMTSPSILLSRRGYAYQDKYALLTFLEFFCKHDLKEFYLDYPFGEEDKSLDILVVTRASQGHAYEIKTGEKFKRDKYKELGQTLKSLYSYQNSRMECKMHLIISEAFRAGLSEHWSCFKFIHEKGRTARNSRGETMLSVAKRYHCKFEFEDIDVGLDEFIRFIKTLKLDIGFSNEKNGEIDRHSNLEDIIMSKVADLGTNLGLVSSEFEMPNWSIALGLLEIIREGAGQNRSIVSLAMEALADSFGRRSLIAKNIEYKNNVSNDEFLRQEKEEISKKLCGISGVPYTVTPSVQSIIEDKPME